MDQYPCQPEGDRPVYLILKEGKDHRGDERHSSEQGNFFWQLREIPGDVMLTGGEQSGEETIPEHRSSRQTARQPVTSKCIGGVKSSGNQRRAPVHPGRVEKAVVVRPCRLNQDGCEAEPEQRGSHHNCPPAGAKESRRQQSEKGQI